LNQVSEELVSDLRKKTIQPLENPKLYDFLSSLNFADQKKLSQELQKIIE
jgi:hypothetical protein